MQNRSGFHEKIPIQNYNLKVDMNSQKPVILITLKQSAGANKSNKEAGRQKPKQGRTAMNRQAYIYIHTEADGEAGCNNAGQVCRWVWRSGDWKRRERLSTSGKQVRKVDEWKVPQNSI